MNKIYVDDRNIKMVQIPKNIYWNNDSKQFQKQSDDDMQEEIPADEWTAGLIRRAADSVSPSIKWEEDYPNNHESGKLPILDLQVWIEEEPGGSKVKFQFYRKPMSPNLMILYNSAMPWNIKRATLTAEVMRILKNTSVDLSWETKATMLTDMARRMKLSGYPHAARATIITQGVYAFHKKILSGSIINKPFTMEKLKRGKLKKSQKSNWYKPMPNRLRSNSNSDTVNKFTTVMFVPATPNSRLKKELEELEAMNNQGRNRRVRIEETPGPTILSQIRSNSHQPPDPCSHPDCLYCRTYNKEEDGTRVSCRKAGACYTIKCMTCEAQLGLKTEYIGETGRALTVRAQDHCRDNKKKTQTSVIHQHALSYHGGAEVQIKFLHNSFHRTPLHRQITESVYGNQR